MDELINDLGTVSNSFSITIQGQQALWDREFLRLNNTYSKEELIKLIIGERP